MICINPNTKEFKDILAQVGDPLAAEIEYNKKYAVEYQKPSIEGKLASEKTIRDLAATISNRIGVDYKIISDRTQEFKGKLENNTAVINLAYATLDTPIHEILGHPIIRAIKNKTVDGNTYRLPEQMSDGSGWAVHVYTKDDFQPELFKTKEEAFAFYNSKQTQLYQNLLKELEYGTGKEVLDRIKRDYNVKKDNRDVNAFIGEFGQKLPDIVYYTLEEQQEEAIVELLGMMTADKLDAVKDGKLISLLKRLLKEIKTFVKQLLTQREVEVDKLPDDMTVGDIADLLAYSNSKLILPGNEVEYTTPDNQKFKTYAEASNHISQLAKSLEEVDLNINFKKEVAYEIIQDNKAPYFFSKVYATKELAETELQKFIAKDDENNSFQNLKNRLTIKESKNAPLNIFIEKNKEYEQSKEIIEEWKKVNNIQYNPEEIYSKGQEFISVVGAYSKFDVNLMMQNLLQHIEDNEKAGGEFTISAFTKPVDKKIGHLEGGGGKIKFKIYPKSKDIKWAANTDVYSGSVWDASEKVNTDKKSELLGVSYTKYPSLSNVNYVQPNLASIVDDLAHHHNELGIALTGNNFRLEYDENIPYETKKIIDSVNSILDQKYGKLVKPEINKSKKETILIDNPLPKNERSGVLSYDSDIRGGYFLDTIYGFEKRGYALGDRISYQQVEKILKIAYPNSVISLQFYTNKVLVDGKDIVTYSGLKYETPDKIEKEVAGIQPTQTKDNLKESIESIKNKVVAIISETDINNGELFQYDGWEYLYENNADNEEGEYQERFGKRKIGEKTGLQSISKSEFEETKDKFIKSIPNKEYTNQALINLKIAKLKEVAKKYPRSLIRSEVKPIISYTSSSYMFEEDELPFQKVPGASSFDNQRISTINSLNDMIKNFRVDEILAEKGYDVRDIISNLETASNQTELNKIINKLLYLLC